ncbi:carcinoembryonic antigen-related cell adhesion molecule 1-like [Haliotis asinina]|uniref:carcinoembryonic antigen-related cell adhesion molecule 1-like n=1 Tax=Haliotis asinina TaxID=109174 RepID=UPI0035322E8E
MAFASAVKIELLSVFFSLTTGCPYTVTRVGEDVNITLNPANVSFLYSVWVNGSVAERLLLVKKMSPHVVVLNSSYTGYKTRITYNGEDPPSQTGQLRFTIYNVTVQDAGTYYCQGNNEEEVTGCTQVLVVAQRPTTPTISGPASAVPGENITLTCSSSSRSLPPDHPSLTMTYIWRRGRTLSESGDESPTHGDDLTITHVRRENQGDTYSCQAMEEGLVSDWSQGHVLDVLYGPDQIHFDGKREKLEAEEGKPVTVRCSAECNPACTVTWWDTSRQMAITGHREAVLYIPAVDVPVSGQYTCHVNNSHGSASRNLTLEVFRGKVYRAGDRSMADNEAQFQQDPSDLYAKVNKKRRSGREVSDVYATVQKAQCRHFMNRAYVGAGPSSENAVLIDYAGPVAAEYNNCGETKDGGLTYADPALESPTLIDGQPIIHRREEPVVYEEIDFALTPGPQLPDKICSLSTLNTFLPLPIYIITFIALTVYIITFLDFPGHIITFLGEIQFFI